MQENETPYTKTKITMLVCTPFSLRTKTNKQKTFKNPKLLNSPLTDSQRERKTRRHARRQAGRHARTHARTHTHTHTHVVVMQGNYSMDL
jgi:hypothetical protein